MRLALSASGFLTLGAGFMLGGDRAQVNDSRCPCFVADYGKGGIYDGQRGMQWKPDSKLGLQARAALDDGRLALTGQVVARGARDGAVNLEWLYATWNISNQLSLQVGRKLLPMFYNSDTQDIGYGLPWTHLPPQLYGWEGVNYNGASLTWQEQWAGWAATANLLGGFEHSQDGGYWTIYNDRQSRTDVQWNDIIGECFCFVPFHGKGFYVFAQGPTGFQVRRIHCSRYFRQRALRLE